MHLLNAQSLALESFLDESKRPDYAILSHTWDTGGEQTYEQLKKVQQRHHPGLQNPQSYPNTAETGDAASSKLDRGESQYNPGSAATELF